MHGETLSENVFVGERLGRIVPRLRRRWAVREIDEWLPGNKPDVLFVCGLRRTGKTTMLLHAAEDSGNLETSAYIDVQPGWTLNDLKRQINILKGRGIRNFFVDEVTRIGNFIPTASIFPDVYARQGLRFVFTGTDSLNFVLAAGSSAFDRCGMVRTTFVPFAEHAYLTGDTDVMAFVENGGTMFSRDDSGFDDYLETAIADNIMNTLAHSMSNKGLVKLQSLRLKGELGNLIQRIVDDRNCRIIIELLENPFFPDNLRNLIENLDKAHDRGGEENPFQREVFENAVEAFKRRLGIMERENRKIKVDESHVNALSVYMRKMDVIKQFRVFDKYAGETDDIVFTQPGLAFCQMSGLISEIGKDKNLSRLFGPASIVEFTEMLRKIALGKIFEDVVIANIEDSLPENMGIFKYTSGENGEIDLVVHDGKFSHCDLFEIKSSKKAKMSHARHLMNDGFLSELPEIRSRNVIYNGPTKEKNGINFLNATDTLLDLPAFFDRLEEGDGPKP